MIIRAHNSWPHLWSDFLHGRTPEQGRCEGEGLVHLRPGPPSSLEIPREESQAGYTLSNKGRTKELMAWKTRFFFKPGAKTYVSLHCEEHRERRDAAACGELHWWAELPPYLQLVSGGYVQLEEPIGWELTVHQLLRCPTQEGKSAGPSTTAW